jgi:hypothetical protein
MVNNPNFIPHLLSSLTCKACGTSSRPGLCAYNYDIVVGVPFYARHVNCGMIFFYMGRRLFIQTVPPLMRPVRLRHRHTRPYYRPSQEDTAMQQMLSIPLIYFRR